MRRKFYRKTNVIRKSMIQCKAWLASWDIRDPWISSFISWRPQVFPETLYTRREIWSFSFIYVKREFFKKIRVRNRIRTPSVCYHPTTRLLLNLQSRRNFSERVLSIFLTKVMAAIFDFNGNGRLGREGNLYHGGSRRSKIGRGVGWGKC